MCRSRRKLSNEYLLAKIGLDTAENEPCKDLQKVCKILQDLQKVCKILQDLQIFLQKFRQKFWQTLNFSRIFFGIFRNFQKNVWNFLLPTNHRYRTTARSAPVDTASTPQLQLLQGSKQRQKSARVATSSVEIDQKSKFDFFSDFQRFQDFHRARSAPPLGTSARPCRPVHRDSPTKKS